MKSVFHIEPSGTVRSVYSDKLSLAGHGTMEVKRASTIEFNSASQQWEVRWAGESDPVFSDPSRDECVKWEVERLNERLARTV